MGKATDTDQDIDPQVASPIGPGGQFALSAGSPNYLTNFPRRVYTRVRSTSAPRQHALACPDSPEGIP